MTSKDNRNYIRHKRKKKKKKKQRGKKESGKGGKEAKRRVSFMDKIKAKFGSPTKEKDKESGKKLSVFHKRSSSRI